MSRTDEDVDPEATRVAVDHVGDFDPLDAVDASDPPPGTVPRGGRALEDLADVLRRAGLQVREVDGWQQRQRGGSGYGQSDPIGIIVHHTASPSSWDGQPDCNFLTFDCDVKPMSNLYLDRGGQWWVLAGGATNTNGAGGPWGPIPTDSANSRVIGIEAGNNGVGEPWPDVMQDAYVAGVAALADAYGVEAGNVLSHREWAPTRKVDPAGPSRFGSGSWDMDLFRAAVNAARGGGGGGGGGGPVKTSPTKPAPSKARTYVVMPGDSWWSITERTLGNPARNWRKLADANGGPERELHPGDVLTVPRRRKPAPSEPATGPIDPSDLTGPGGPAVPTFPGDAELGDRGPIVLTWQEALIAHRVISDNAANRDSHYGDGMYKAMLKLQRSWGWSDADGVAGRHTWRKLHGGD